MKERCRKIYEVICGAKKLSIRQIGRITKIPKSGTHRHKMRIEKRNIYPESGYQHKAGHFITKI